MISNPIASSEDLLTHNYKKETPNKFDNFSASVQLQLLSVVVTLSKAVRVMYQAVRRGRLHRASEQRRQQHIVEPNFKNPPKNKLKKLAKLTGHRYACNNLTSFGCEVHTIIGTGNN